MKEIYFLLIFLSLFYVTQSQIHENVNACCYSGECFLCEESFCDLVSGLWQGDNSTCDNTTCIIATTAVQTTAVQTTAVQTTAIQTTAVQTTSVPTTGAVTTGGVTTGAIQTTAVQTTAVTTTTGLTTGSNTFEACCLSNGTCAICDPSLCALAGGTSQGPGSNCEDVICNVTSSSSTIEDETTEASTTEEEEEGEENEEDDFIKGACCYKKECRYLYKDTCKKKKGTFGGEGTICLSPYGCQIGYGALTPPEEYTQVPGYVAVGTLPAIGLCCLCCIFLFLPIVISRRRNRRHSEHYHW